MSGASGGGERPAGEQVGGVAEEALKLVAALSEWAHEHETPGEHHGSDRSASDRQASPECEWCPLCRALRAVQATRPEVREHLAAAGSSLVAALAAALAPPADLRDGGGPTPDPEEQT